MLMAELLQPQKGVGYSGQKTVEAIKFSIYTALMTRLFESK